jgi:hypothetical protein
MLVYELIVRLIKPRIRRVLSLAEISMGEANFLLFKKEFLHEFGNSEFVRDMERELTKYGKARSGAAPAKWNGQK